MRLITLSLEWQRWDTQLWKKGLVLFTGVESSVCDWGVQHFGDCGVTEHHTRFSRTYYVAAEEERQTEGMTPASIQRPGDLPLVSLPQVSSTSTHHEAPTSNLGVLGNAPDPNQGSTQPTTGPSASLWLHPPSHGRVPPLLPIMPVHFTVSHPCGKGKRERRKHTICFVDIGLHSLLRRTERTN